MQSSDIILLIFLLESALIIVFITDFCSGQICQRCRENENVSHSLSTFICRWLDFDNNIFLKRGDKLLGFHFQANPISIIEVMPLSVIAKSSGNQTICSQNICNGRCLGIFAERCRPLACRIEIHFCNTQALNPVCKCRQCQGESSFNIRIGSIKESHF